jgi:hypothetical protein
MDLSELNTNGQNDSSWLTEEHLNSIGLAHVELPYKVSFGVLASIQKQVMEQRASRR